MDEAHLAAVPPGAALAALLAGPSSAEVAAAGPVGVLQAWSRQLAHAQAEFLAAVVEVSRSTPFSGPDDGEPLSAARSVERLMAVGAWAAGEIAAVLRWSHGSAERELGLARQLVDELPLVFAALRTGSIDRGKAWTFADVLGAADLTAGQVERICAALVLRAGCWTTGQLRARLLRMVLEVDPGYAERRYRKAVQERTVVGYLAPDGTGVVTGSGLPAGEAIAACERLEALADEVHRAGHPGTVHQIRADLFTRLLDGRFEGLSAADMVAAMLAEAAAEPEAAETEAAAAEPRAAEPTTAAEPKPAEAEAASEAAEPAASEAAELAASEAAELAAAEAAAEPEPADAEHADAADAGVHWGGEIRVGLSTLLGSDERPGDVPGWGPVLADVARAMVAERHRGEWRFAVTDAEGHLILAGVTRRRPRRTAGRDRRSGVVELHLPATLLAELAGDAERCGEWAAVVADIARQYARRDQLRAALSNRPGDRFAHAALRRHAQVRDRRCVAPGCRGPARHCELDHTVAHFAGGETVPENVGPLCTRHHRMKHEAGWRLEQPEPGHFRWTSPLGRTYWTRSEPILLPEVVPEPRPTEPPERWRPARLLDEPIMQRPPPEPVPPPRPAPVDDEPCPF